jgi:hypothetical protein
MDQSEKLLRLYIRESLISDELDRVNEVVYSGQAGGFETRAVHPLVYQVGRSIKYLGRAALGAASSLGRFVRNNAGAIASVALSGGLAYLAVGPKQLLEMGSEIKNSVKGLFTDENKIEAIDSILPPEIDPSFLSNFVATLKSIEEDSSEAPQYDCRDLESAFTTDLSGLRSEIAIIKQLPGRSKISRLWGLYSDVTLLELDEEKYKEATKDLTQEEINSAVERFIEEANLKVADIVEHMLSRSKNARSCQTSMRSVIDILRTMN